MKKKKKLLKLYYPVKNVDVVNLVNQLFLAKNYFTSFGFPGTIDPSFGIDSSCRLLNYERKSEILLSRKM